MGRKLAFSREKALREAMENFWQRGYEATSMRELAQKLGLHLGSVYNTLGSKEKVFEEALRLNFAMYQMPKLEKLKTHPRPLEALTGMLENAAEECSDPAHSMGCFIINSLDEITRINDGVTSFLHDYIRQKEAAITACLVRAQEQKEIPPGKNPEKLAKLVVAVLFSMRVLAKMGLPAEGIRDVKDCALQAITE